MAKKCQVTGKMVMVGNNVSHAKNRIKRKFYPNLLKKKFFLPDEDRWVSLTVSTHGIRLINKIGISAALKKAKEKGYIGKY
jgi:large subunit ribosomal protein L28